jgi:hypothetical protein
MSQLFFIFVGLTSINRRNPKEDNLLDFGFPCAGSESPQRDATGFTSAIISAWAG